MDFDLFDIIDEHDDHDEHGLSLPDPDYEFFKSEFRKRTGIILNLYKEKQMKRRINTLIERKGCRNYLDFLNMLDTSPAQMDEFLDYITINVTEFFRTPEHWEHFEEEVLAGLAGSKKKLKIWSCACATGEEAYSTAISLAQLPAFQAERQLCPAGSQTEVLPETAGVSFRNSPERTEETAGVSFCDYEILATDIDDKVLEIASKGIYDEKSISGLSDYVKNNFFEREGSVYRVSDEIRKHVTFRKMDLLQDEYPRDCDVILCRNVLIYFTEEAKEMMYEKFQESLVPGGYLFTGNTEQIIYYKKFGYQKICAYLYKKA